MTVRAALGLSLLGLVACQAPAGPDVAERSPTNGAGQDTGSVSLALTLGGGLEVSSVHYDVSGNGFHRAADVSVQNSQTFSTLVSGLPFGTGYVAKLSFQDVGHHLLPCEGSATFAVTSAGTVSVPVHLACKQPSSIVVGGPWPSVPVPRWAALALGALLLFVAGRRVRAASLLVTLALPLASSGCAAGVGDHAGAAESDTGAVRMALQVAAGTSLNAIAYRIDGPGAFSKMGTIDLSASSTIAFDVSPLPPGAGFQLALDGMSSAGNARCMGAATFDVAARQTTTVLVHLLCQLMPVNGRVAVSGALDVCPVIDSLGASPAEVLVGQALALSALAHDLDGAPAALTYQWTTSGGALSAPGSPGPWLTCTSPGPVDVTLTVSDGDPACADARTLTVICTAP